MTTPASAEPTAEQRLWALTFVTRVLECETPEQIDDTERDLARALAAAVTAEREKYLRVADELDVIAARVEEQAARRGELRGHSFGYSAASQSAARRIREVSS